MYKYIYVESENEGLLSNATHREIINEYSRNGWRFVTAIPKTIKANGKFIRFDLVFEKEE